MMTSVTEMLLQHGNRLRYKRSKVALYSLVFYTLFLCVCIFFIIMIFPLVHFKSTLTCFNYLLGMTATTHTNKMKQHKISCTTVANIMEL